MTKKYFLLGTQDELEAKRKNATKPVKKDKGLSMLAYLGVTNDDFIIEPNEKGVQLIWFRLDCILMIVGCSAEEFFTDAILETCKRLEKKYKIFPVQEFPDQATNSVPTDVKR